MIEKENKVIKAVIYARFSSDMQREESIDAQVRACKYYANNDKIEIVDIYEDKAKSGTTVKGRDAFLQMIEDSANGTFDMVLVHKLNRFGRDVLDTLNYKKTLAKNGVTLTSVTEKLDGSPEGQLMLMIIAGMNQFYSANLSAEVMKGLKENAHNCKHTGGVPPLGYDVDPITKQLCINENEADCVKLIFKMYLEGEGYTKIVDAINLQGYTSKNGKSLTKHSFNSILKNEKYVGNYIFNKSAKKDLDGKRNGNKYKSRDEWIIVENGCPAIISK